MSRADIAHMEERMTLAIATATEQIVDAIRQTGAEQNANREAMAKSIMEQGSAILRTALDDAAPRAVDIGPPAANDETRYAPGPTTPPGGPANDDAPAAPPAPRAPADAPYRDPGRAELDTAPELILAERRRYARLRVHVECAVDARDLLVRWTIDVGEGTYCRAIVDADALDRDFLRVLVLEDDGPNVWIDVPHEEIHRRVAEHARSRCAPRGAGERRRAVASRASV